VAEDEDLRPRNADEALEWLLAGNERFVTGRPRHDHETLRRRLSLAEHQQPFAVILGCADSRVPPELVFDHGFGDIFVIRVAGNVVAEDEAGSLEYGAVTAALGSIDDEPPELVTLLRRIRTALVDIDRSLPEQEQIQLGVEANIRQSARQIEAIVAPHADDRIKVVSALYDLDSGRVRVLD
jgi:carbonic anhydrase